MSKLFFSLEDTDANAVILEEHYNKIIDKSDVLLEMLEEINSMQDAYNNGDGRAEDDPASIAFKNSLDDKAALFHSTLVGCIVVDSLLKLQEYGDGPPDELLLKIIR